MNNSVLALKSVYAKLNYILTNEQKRKAIWVFITMIISAILELLSVTVILPFLTLITDADKVFEKWYFAWLMRINPDITIKFLVVFMCIIFIFVYLGKNVFMVYAAYVQSAYAAGFRRENSTKMLKLFLEHPYEFFVNTNSSTILRSINGDIDAVYQILLDIFNIITQMFTVIFVGGYLLLNNWKVALCTALLMLFCFLAVTLGFKNKLNFYGIEARNASINKGKASRHAVAGIKEISVMDRRDLFVEKYSQQATIEEETYKLYNFLAACPPRIIEAVCMSGFMLIICFAIMIDLEFVSFIPLLGAFAMGALKIMPAVAGISARINSIVYNIPSMNCCYNNMKEGEEIILQKKNNDLIAQGEEYLQAKKEHFNNKLEIKNVCWKYMKAKGDVLNNISLTIHKGESIGLIGPSGAGKTTLADIIMGLFEPQSGEVLVDGKNIFAITHSWAQMIGYVPQTVYLIDDTLRNNIAFGIPESQINDILIWKALEQAHLSEYVHSLPKGLDTVVGERGVKFSGGQKQRVAIARALYNDPDILVFDEATSALDKDTETAVMESINALHNVKTLIIVAHRLTTISNCDIVYEINNGGAVVRTKEELGI